MHHQRHIKIGSIITIAIAIFLAGYLISHLSKWQKSEEIFPLLNKELISGGTVHLPQTWNKSIMESNAYILIQTGRYTEALALITGESTQDRYNRGIITTLMAYTQASKSDFSGLQSSNALINDAKNDFLFAQELQNNNELMQAITKNLQTVEELGIVITAKTCYVISDTIVNDLSGLQNTIDTIREMIKTENTALQKDKSITPDDCFQQWLQTLSVSDQNLQSLKESLAQQSPYQARMYMQQRINPALCLHDQDSTVIDNLNETQKMLADFSQQHQQSLAIWDKPTSDIIQALCQQTKNDSQIDESIQNTIDKLLASLNNNLQSAEIASGGISTTPHYIQLNAQDQKLLETIDKKNKIRIRQIQRLKTDPQYSGSDYVQSLFYQFYGNTGDFQ